ncbi:hypothetical protein GQ55_6G215300 [Panicum hallii var. hallii]|uniref:Reverse transcriptase zinc-binding domain-containing protein n=1 Tax=Panicum hallii var. hallii TaxID=1504633 RepID=A0A2T7D871_9POAL|nr:hypothetical protein GQ55_6G215300 [Panicum hallii var. hallii]
MALPSYDCVLCTASVEETLEHLFLPCPFATACWGCRGLLGLHLPPQADIFEVIDSFKIQLHTPIFMNIVTLLCWSISRNDLIFQGLQPSSSNCLMVFKKELMLLVHRVKSKHKSLLEEWIAIFV